MQSRWVVRLGLSAVCVLLCFLLGTAAAGVSLASADGTSAAVPPQQATIDAQVLARGSILRLAGVTVLVRVGEYSDRVQTDAKGHFLVRVPAGLAELTLSSPGFESLHAQQSLRADSVVTTEYLLRPLPAFRRPFESTVRASAQAEGQHVSLSGEELRTLPGSLGDPFRAIGLLPGVATPIPLLPVFVVRGASPGMNGFFLDGMRVPQLFHILVGGGVVHSRLVEQLDFYPGAYDASLGRYAGGIIDAKTRAARKDGYHGELEVRLFDVSALIELPLTSELRVTASGHYGYPGLIVNAIDDRVALTYWDYQLRVDYRGLTVQALGSYDSVSIVDPRLTTGTNMPVANNFRQTFHRLQARYIAHAGRFTVEAGAVGGIDEMTIFQGNGVRKLSLNLRLLGSARFSRLRLRFGVDTELSRFTAENFATEDEQVRARPDDLGDLAGARDGVVASAFAVASYDLFTGVTATLSGRIDLYHAGTTTLLGLDPRFQLRAQLTDWLLIHLGTGYYQQPPSFPVALPGIDTFALRLGLQHAIHGAVGEEITLPANITLAATGFFQRYRNANDVVLDFSPLLCTSPPPESLSGYPAQITRQVAGDSYGLELMLRRASAKNRISGWIAYTLGRAERAFTCGLRPADYDQTHVLNTVLQVRLPLGLMVGARLFLSTGRPVTRLELPDGSATLRNNERLPTNLQLDFRLDREWLFRRFALDVFLEVVNATYSEAVFGLAYPKEGNVTRYDMPVTNGFRWILPSIGVRGRF